MRLQLALLAAAAALTTSGTAGAAATGSAGVDLRDMVARVTVIPEDRSDVKVEFARTNPKLPIQVRNEGGRVVLDGDLEHRIRNCHHGDRPRVSVRGVGDVGADEMPQVIIHAPRSVSISSNGAVFGSVGRAAALELQDSGCSAWTVADVAGEARVRESGAGSIKMGAADRLDVSLSGAANIHAVRARQGLDAKLSGAGHVEVGEVNGAVEAHVSGFGGVRMDSGHINALRASVSGVGGVEFGGTVDNLDAAISGVGSVRVKQVTGNVSKRVSGIGHVSIG